MNCQNCDSYNRGNGSPACLTCAKYKDICKQSGRRKTIQIDTVPQAILEEIADDHPQISGLVDAIRALPPDHAALISMIYLGGLTHQEAAEILKISRSAVTKKIKLSIEIIRQSTR